MSFDSYTYHLLIALYRSRHQNIHVGKDVAIGGMRLLLNEGDLRSRNPVLCRTWENEMSRMKSSVESTVKLETEKAKKALSDIKLPLRLSCRLKALEEFMKIYPYVFAFHVI